MTSKEALKLLYSDAENYAYFNETEEDLSEIKAEYELIKQDLDRLEKFAHENASLHTEIDSLHTENAKLKKVIEIMVDKKVSQFWIVMSESVDRYNAVMGKNYILTQEEFDLLKEYL